MGRPEVYWRSGAILRTACGPVNRRDGGGCPGALSELGGDPGSGGFGRRRLALAGLKARVFLVNDIDPAAPADDSAVLVAFLGRPKRIDDFHGVTRQCFRPCPLRCLPAVVWGNGPWDGRTLGRDSRPVNLGGGAKIRVTP